MVRTAAEMAVVPLLVAALAALWVWQCSGPDPAVHDVELLEPEQPGDPYTVQATLDNERWGHGTVTLAFELTDNQSGQTFREEKRVRLEEGDDDVLVFAEIDAPDGDYEPSVEAEYPPE
jgi:hypothetical protein